MGKMVAKGSVDEIKKKFGIGYNLIINHDPKAEEKLGFETEILSRIKGSFLDEKNSSELKSYYTLPFEAVDEFPGLFE